MYQKPKQVAQVRVASSYAVHAELKMVFGHHPNAGVKECVTRPPDPKPLGG